MAAAIEREAKILIFDGQGMDPSGIELLESYAKLQQEKFFGIYVIGGVKPEEIKQSLQSLLYSKFIWLAL